MSTIGRGLFRWLRRPPALAAAPRSIIAGPPYARRPGVAASLIETRRRVIGPTLAPMSLGRLPQA